MGKPKYSALDVVEAFTVDESATTIAELCESRGIDSNMGYMVRDDMLQQGLWEKVKKHSARGRLIDAYRLTAKGWVAADMKRKAEAEDA
jgi:hypothetical protein